MEDKKRISPLCRLFGHRMALDTPNSSGPSHCRRWGCGHTAPGIKWPWAEEVREPVRVKADPGDVLVFKMNAFVPMPKVAVIREALEASFPENKIIVLTKAIDMVAIVGGQFTDNEPEEGK